MKRFFFLALLMILSRIGFAQPISWSEQVSGITTALNSVSAADDNNAWACGINGIVLKTTNGGSTWINVSGAPIPGTLILYNIFGLDGTTAFVTGTSVTATFVYRTTNGGTSWTQVFTQNGGFVDAIWMANSTTGLLVGDPVTGGTRWSIFGTISSGTSWDSANFYIPRIGTEAGWNNSMYFTGTTVFFGTNNTRVYKTNNLISWAPQTTPGQVNSYAVWFNNATNGMTGGTGLLFTTNTGAVWANTTSPLPGSANILGISGYGTNWVIVRNAAQILFSTNDGGSWTTPYTAAAGNYTHINKSRATGNTFWAVRDNGGITIGALLTGIEPVSGTVPSKFSLQQNYPNPFNPVTDIKFSVPKESFVNLVVFDALGREVTRLVNENLKSGIYKVNFDGSNLSSGIYFYKLTAGDFIETKKMSLTK